MSRGRGIPWWSSGWDSVLSMSGAWVPSLVREPDPTCHNRGSCMPQWRLRFSCDATEIRPTQIKKYLKKYVQGFGLLDSHV